MQLFRWTLLLNIKHSTYLHVSDILILRNYP